MRCYYEVLEVSKEADAAEIKTSYRKLALKWHPDKNLDSAEEAKEQFQLVQNAYEVLSDPQERAWYDNHRDQLLRGAGSEFNDESLDLIPYFTASCYKGYGDDEKGFYAVYGEVFKKLAAEETDYLEDPEDVTKIPTFGKSDTDYENVQEFYSYWLSFSTSKSFVWLDKYDIREADNRKILKILEKENNKIRQKARKERNEEVRQLVNFIRKRDKRVIAYAKLKEEKALENKRKMEEARREKLLKRQQEIEEAKKRQSDIGVYNMDNFNEQLEQIEKHFVEEFGDSDEENYVTESSDEETPEANSNVDAVLDIEIDNYNLQNLYCMACNKPFKNVKSFENHEKSKKHKENVMNLKLDVEIEMSDGENNKDDAESNTSNEEISNKDNQTSTRGKKKKKNKKQKVFIQDSDDETEETSIADLDLNLRSRKARRAKNLESVLSKSKSTENKSLIEDEKPANGEIITEVSNGDDENVIMENCEKDNRTSRVKEDDNKTGSGKSKKKDKKTSQKKTTIPVTVDVSNIDTSHCCAICKGEFSSKNKLFDHLKKTGHQIYLPELHAAGNTKAQKKKSRQK